MVFWQRKDHISFASLTWVLEALEFLKSVYKKLTNRLWHFINYLQLTNKCLFFSLFVFFIQWTTLNLLFICTSKFKANICIEFTDYNLKQLGISLTLSIFNCNKRINSNQNCSKCLKFADKDSNTNWQGNCKTSTQQFSLVATACIEN